MTQTGTISPDVPWNYSWEGPTVDVWRECTVVLPKRFHSRLVSQV